MKFEKNKWKFIGGGVLRMLGTIGGSALMVVSIKDGFSLGSILGMVVFLVLAVGGAILEQED